jgi:hypothetical protein
MVSVSDLQDSFVARLPWMQNTARAAFHRLDPDKKEEAVANTIALAYRAFARLNERGKADNPGILQAVIWYSIRQTKAGRRIDSARKPKDPLVLRVYGKVTFESPDLIDGLVGRKTPIPDAVSFRLDVPAFLTTLSKRNRRMAMDLAEGRSTTEVAEKYGVSAGRVSQFRREFKTLFDRFFAEAK